MSAPNSTNIYRNRVVPVVVGATGIGVAQSYIFQKVFENNGAPGILQLGLSNVVGSFSALTINVEWSPTNGSGTYFEVVPGGTWTPLTNGVGLVPIAESGYYRLNVTAFTGGTSFDVLATVGLPAGSVSSGGGGPSSNVTIVGSTVTLPVSLAGDVEVVQDTAADLNATVVFASPQHVIVDSGNIAVTGTVAVSGATFTGGSLNVNVTNSTGSSVTGTLTNNNAAPAANNLGVLPSVANAAAPTWTEGNQVLLSEDLAGNLRTLLPASQITTLTPPTAAAIAAAIVANPPTTFNGVVTNAGTFAVQASQSGSWTVTANQGTSPWVVSGAVTVSGTATVVGTLTNNNAAPAATNVGALVALANAANPTWTEGDQVLLSEDLSGNLRVITGAGSTTAVTGTVAVTQSTSPWVVSFSAPQHVIIDSATLGTVTVTGTVAISGTVAVTQSGTWTVQQGSAPWSFVGTLTNNNAAPAANNVGALVALANAANPTWTEGDQVLLSEDLSGNLRVKINAALPAGTNVIGHVITDSGSTTVVTGTVAVTQSTNPWVITGNESVNVGAPGADNLGVLAAQANAAAQTWTEGNSVPLSVDLAGNLRTTGTFSASLLNDRSVTGTITAVSQTVAINTQGCGEVSIDVSGTFTANCFFEGTIDGTNWFGIYCAPWGSLFLGATIPATTQFNNAPGRWTVACASLNQVRVRCFAYTSGTITVVLTAAQGEIQTLATIANLPLPVAGNNTTNTNTGGINALNTLPAIATTSAPSLTNGLQVALSTDLSGNLRVTGTTAISGTVAVTQSTSPWVVAGANAAGSTSIGNPVILGGSDYGGTPKTQTLKVDSSGNIYIGGTVAVTQSTSPWVVSLASTTITGNVSVVGTDADNAANSTTKLPVIPARANAAAPSWTEGHEVPLSVDLSGNLRVNSSGSTFTGNITQWNSVNLGSPSNYGTSPGAVEVIGVNAFVTNTVTVSGTVTANIGTTGGLALDTSVNGILVAQGSTTSGESGPLMQGAVTTSAPTYTTGKTDPLSLTTAGALRVDGSAVTQPVSGTFWQSTQPVSIAATVTVQGSAAATTNITGNPVLMGGSDYGGTPKAQNLKVDSSGQIYIGNAVAISGTVAVTQSTSPWVTQDKADVATGGTAPGFAIITGGVYTTSPPGLTTTQIVQTQVDQVGNALQMPGAQSITGAVWGTSTTLNTVQYPTFPQTTIGAPIGAPVVICQLEMSNSTFTAGAVTFQGTYDGTNWVTIPVAQVVNPQTYAQLSNPYTFVANSNVPFMVLMQGFQNVRLKLTTAITGSSSPTVSPFWTVTPELSSTFVTNTVAVSGTVAFSNTTIAVTNAGTFAVQEATLDAALIAQEATTSGVKGLTAFGAVTTSAPSYSTGKSDALSLDTAGNLRVIVSGGSTANPAASATGSAVPADADYNGLNVGGTLRGQTGVNPSGTVYAAQTDITSVGGTTVSNVTAGVMDFNVKAINNVTPLMGNGTTGTGSQRVTIASDNTAFSVNATLSAETTKVIGTVRTLGNTGAVMDAVTTAATAPANGLATLVEYVSTTPALTTGQSVMLQSDQTGAEYVNTEGRKKTYSTYASFTAAAGVVFYLPGNATTTVRVTRVEVSLSTSGTAGLSTVSLIKTSAAPTGGTAASTTIVPHDSNFAGASSVPQNYTVAPTPGTPVGTIRGMQMFDESSTVAGANTWIWDWGMRPASAVVLRGTAQTLEINVATVVSTQTCTLSVEWTEE